VAAETIAHAKLMAPRTFRTRLMRAVTAGDYAALAEADPRVQRASAELVWTGSWYEADVAIDPLGSEAMPDGLLADVAHQLERYRRIGHDLHVKPAVMVALDLRLEVCVQPGHRRAEVRAALQAAFGTGRLADGSLRFFHPDALSFGTGIALSRIVARAQAVPGVAHVAVTRLQRLYEGANGEIEAGLLARGGGEIARLDNDSNRPEHGRLELVMLGGR
jgi:predicted phage baseplate assembly protein